MLASIVKMATALEGYATEDQPSLLRVLWAKELTREDIHKEVFPA
jgi:hypothetical protein